MNSEIIAEFTQLLSQYVALAHIFQAGNNSIILLRRQRAAASRRAQALLEEVCVSLNSNHSNRIGRAWTLLRAQTWWDSIVPQMSDDEWKANFRISKDTFDVICMRIRAPFERTDTAMRRCIPLQKRVAVAAFFLASTAEYRTVGNLFGIAKCTVGLLVNEFCDVVVRSMLWDTMKFYDGVSSARNVMNGFWQDWGFPQCIGAIGGCHIPICPPKDYAVDYCNFKGWHSIILLAIVDHHYKFVYINAGAPGKNNDAYIFRKSTITSLMTQPWLKELATKMNDTEVPPVLLGDSSFPSLTFLMKPYPESNTLSDQQKHFNYKLSCARSVVENAFGRLKGRFRCLSRKLELQLKNIPHVIQTCCILHNICELLQDTFDSTWIVEGECTLGGHSLLSNNSQEENKVRLALTKFLTDNPIGCSD